MIQAVTRIDINIDMSDDQINSFLRVLGELIINRVKDFVRRMKLVVSGNYLQGFFSSVEGRNIVIENTEDYAIYLEYGTYSYYDSYGVTGFTEPVHPKKKDIGRKEASGLPKGMQPYASVRRVIYNEAIMEKLIAEALRHVL